MESKRELAFIHSPLWRVQNQLHYIVFMKNIFRKQVETYRSRIGQAHKLRKYLAMQCYQIFFQCTSKKGVDVFNEIIRYSVRIYKGERLH